MAIDNQKLSTSLIIKLDAGVNENGKSINKIFTLRKIKPAAADQDVYDVGTSLAGIMKLPVSEISRQDLSALISE